MLDDAVALAAAADEPDEQNFIAAHVRESLAEHGDDRRARTRYSGPSPAPTAPACCSSSTRSSGAPTRTWLRCTPRGAATRTDADSTVVRRSTTCAAYRRINVAAKNTDTREHDIADSDDYFQYHGGMVATVRAHRLRSRGLHR